MLTTCDSCDEFSYLFDCPTKKKRQPVVVLWLVVHINETLDQCSKNIQQDPPDLVWGTETVKNKDNMNMHFQIPIGNPDSQNGSVQQWGKNAKPELSKVHRCATQTILAQHSPDAAEENLFKLWLIKHLCSLIPAISITSIQSTPPVLPAIYLYWTAKQLPNTEIQLYRHPNQHTYIGHKYLQASHQVVFGQAPGKAWGTAAATHPYSLIIKLCPPPLQCKPLVSAWGALCPSGTCCLSFIVLWCICVHVKGLRSEKLQSPCQWEFAQTLLLHCLKCLVWSPVFISITYVHH